MTYFFVRHNQDNSYTGNQSYWHCDSFRSYGDAAQSILNGYDNGFIGWQEVEDQIRTIRKMSEDMPASLTDAYEALCDALRSCEPSVVEISNLNLTMQLFDHNHNLVWTEGERSFDFGDFTTSIEEVECDDPNELLEYLQSTPHTGAADLQWVLDNELGAS